MIRLLILIVLFFKLFYLGEKVISDKGFLKSFVKSIVWIEKKDGLINLNGSLMSS
jgi:hypothetical protein